LALKQQIEKFNELLEKQKELMDSQANVSSLPNSNELLIPGSKFLSPLSKRRKSQWIFLEIHSYYSKDMIKRCNLF